MKTCKSLLRVAFVIAALGVVPAFAQTTICLKANVPFDFQWVE
jgi:hypothetical protein